MFTDFVVPDPALGIGLFLITAVVVILLYGIRPPVTEAIVMAVVPWIISGALLHVFYQMHLQAPGGLFPEPIAPLFSAPSVYLTTFSLLGLIWVMATIIVPSNDHDRQIARYLGTTGFGIMMTLVGLAVWQGLGDAFEVEPILPILGLVVSMAVTFVVFIAIGIWRTYVIAQTRYVGALVLFGHIFDAITTAIGIELMGAGERSTLPRMMMDFAADLPTQPYLGEAWLFVVVKIVVASAIVVLFADYVRERPNEGNLFLAIIAAVGLGPGVHNFFLFMLGV